jgi:hypothetical protein
VALLLDEGQRLLVGAAALRGLAIARDLGGASQ